MEYLVGDIGGTKTLLAIFHNDTLVREEKFVSHEYAGLENIIEIFLRKGGEKIGSACFGIAGPVVEGVSRTTNLPWVVDVKRIAKQFDIHHVSLINDLQANAYGLNNLSDKDLYTINKGSADPKGNKCLISAGTGLGEAPIVFTDGKYIPVASEGGHSDFAPRNDLEIELWRYLQKQFGHVSYERVVSGQGLFNLYKFLIECHYEKENPVVKEKMKDEAPPIVISSFGLNGKDRACKRALEWFCSLYAGEAGNLALKVLATGGVYIGGGIAPKIIKTINQEEFLKSFSDKGRFSSLLRSFPIHIVLDERTALKGALFFCKRNTIS